MEQTQESLDFWRQQFPNRIEPSGMPLDRPRPPAPSYLRDSAGARLAAADVALLEKQGSAAGVSVALVVFAALETVIFRRTGLEKLITGAFLPELEALVPVHSHWDTDSTGTLTARAEQISAWLRKAAGHAFYPLRELQRWAGAADPVFGHRLFDTAFIWNGEGGTGRTILENEFGDFLAQCDVVFTAAPGAAGGIELDAEFDADVFTAGTMQNVLNNVAELLAGAASQPDLAAVRLPMLSAVEREHIVSGFNQTARTFPPVSSLQELIEVQIERTPDAIALTFEHCSLSYRELDTRANRLANFLRKRGASADMLIGICVERSQEMVIGLLGILKAGAAYVPIDPSYPSERLAYMIKDTGAGILLTQHHLLTQLPAHSAEAICLDADWPVIAGESPDRPDSWTLPGHLAYMIYTSGSTGKPKGALNTHRGIINRLLWMQDEYRLTPDDHVLQKTPFSFDVSVWEFFWPLLAGARLVLARPEGHKDPDYLSNLIVRENITVLHFVPSMLRAFIDADCLGRCKSLHDVICSGEALPPDLVAAFYARSGANLHNLYGPTEAAVDVTYWACPRDHTTGTVPIGRPVANTQCYILDAHLEVVPIGVAGELHLGGVQIGRGYYNRPELTTDKFIPDPFSTESSSLLYKTGDLCRYLPGGDIEYLGRMDHQVKIRGFRIELGEIESALIRHSLIKDAVVVAHETTPGEKKLVAYVVVHSGMVSDEVAWRKDLRDVLPAFMIPADFVVLDALPLNPNGKVDRKALPQPIPLVSSGQEEVNHPSSVLERRIADTWREVLGTSQIDRKINFFDAGGDSLLLIRVRKHLREQWQIDVPVLTLFQHPTIASLAEFVERDRQEARVSAGTAGITGIPDSCRTPTETDKSPEDNRIAIVGMAGRFPGARNPEQLWENLRNGVESVSFFTAEELRAAGVPRRLLENPNFVRAKAVMEEADAFDAEFFGYLPSEVEMMDPQHRVFLECAWSALEDAGYDPSRYAGSIGVFGGMSQTTYLPLLKRLDPDGAKYHGYPLRLGTDKDYLTTRVSYKLNLRGPSVNVQTACSTSLVAVCQACQHLLSHSCDMALAGGAAVAVPLQGGHLHQDGSIHSSDGHCRPFDAESQGIVEGDGVGIVVLKRLADAIADGDTVHAVIRGFALNNDGAGKIGFTAPSADGQAAVVASALTMAGVSPDSISCVEAHGTGTQLGDPIEIAGLTKAFRAAGATGNGFCAIGSVKSNFGHLDTAAGVTGLIKTVLALRNRELPPTLHFIRPNPAIDFANSPFFVNSLLQEWTATDNQPRRAGVSSFGLGGTNAHVILEEAPPHSTTETRRPWELIVLSARSTGALHTMAANLAGTLVRRNDLKMEDVAFTLQTGRFAFNERCAFVARDVSEASELLSRPDSKRVVTGRARSEPPGITFLFPGQGAQQVNMGRELYELEPVFRDQVDHCAQILQPLLSLDLRRVLYPDESDVEAAQSKLGQTSLTQPALFVVEYALARLWMSWGIVPDSMLGHSVGEYVAACLAGVLTLEDALFLVVSRGRLMQELPPGSMLAVRLSEAEVLPLLGDQLSLAAVNSPSVCVISGPTEAIAELEEQFQMRGIKGRRLATSHAFHSAMMEPLKEPITAMVANLPRRAPKIPYLSNVSARWVTEADVADPGYWYRHLRHAVRFADCVAELTKTPSRILLEVGPGQTLSTLARQHSSRLPAQSVFASMAAETAQKSEFGAMLTTLGRLWVEGAAVDWPALPAHTPRHRISLPGYAFERKRFWPSPAERPLESSSVPAADGSAARTPDAHSETPLNHSEAMPSPISRQSRILDEMLRVLQELSGMDVANIEPSKTFLELGFDSLFLGQASQAFQKTFGVKLRFRDFFEAAPTPNEMAALLDQKVSPDKFPAILPSPVSTGSATDSKGAGLPLTRNADSQLPAAVSMPLPGNPAPGVDAAAVERIVAQQLQAVIELTRQQLAALGRAGSVPASVSPASGIATAVAEVIGSVPGDRRTAPIKIFGGSGALTYLRTPHVEWRPLEQGPGNGLTIRQEEHLRRLIHDYTRRTAKSQQCNGQIRAQVADPRTVVGFAPLWKDAVYQIVAARSAGSRVWDIDGNEYVDVTLGFGAAIFGHSPDFVIKAIKEQVDLGMELGVQSPLAGEVAKLFCELTGHERVCFCTAGTEAVMGALRLARAHTGRDRFATFVGDIHGRLDETCGRPLIVNNERTTVPGAPGIASHLVKPAMFLEFGDPASLEAIERHADELAAVLVEPVRTRSPDLQPVEFLRDLRNLAARKGITFICDEVVTGFRVAQGGAQAYFDLKPDLSTWGKGVAAGMPMGIISGKAEFMDALDGGMWHYGDNSVPETAMTNFGGAGTFAKHPYSMAATLAALRHMKASGPQLQEKLNERTETFVRTLNTYFCGERIPIHLEHFSSFWSPRVLGDRKFEPLLFVYLRQLGVHIYVDYPCFLSTAHTDADVAFLVESFKRAARMMQEGGFLPDPPGDNPGGDGSVKDPDDSNPQNPDGSGRKVRRERDGGPAIPGGQHGAGEPPLPLTSAQMEIWLASRLGPESSAAFNLSSTIELRGDLDGEALRSALHKVVARHEALRLVISPEGDHQRFLPELTLTVPEIDWSGRTVGERDDCFSQFLRHETMEPFDLVNGPLLRASLIKFSGNHHRLVLTVFHIACDGWGLGMVIKDLSIYYSALVRGKNPDVPGPMQYSEYLAWRRQDEQTEDRLQAEAYWVGQFEESNPVLDLPTDQPRPPRKTFDGWQESVTIDFPLLQKLKSAAASQGCTFFAMMVAAYGVLLHRLSGQTEFVIGMEAAGQAHVGNDHLVGHCVNLLPYRTQVNGGGSFSTYLHEVKLSLMDAYDHQGCTLGDLLGRIRIPRDPSRSPLVSTTMTHETDTAGIQFAGLDYSFMSNRKAACNFDLELYLNESKTGMEITFSYNTSLFSTGTIGRWLHHFTVLLGALPEKMEAPIASLPLMDASDRHHMLVEWNDTGSDFPRDACTHDLVSSQARRTPDAVAVVFGDKSMTYRELDQRSNQLAHYLQKRRVGPDTLVGLCVERSIEMVVAMLGVMKAGGAYIPIDPLYPAERIAFVLLDAQASVLITSQALAGSLGVLPAAFICLDRDAAEIAMEQMTPPDSPVQSHHLAYVIFTSGSTGKPKGVQIEHRALVNFLHSMRLEPGMTANDVLLAVTTISFDIAGLEIFLPLMIGARVVIATRETAADSRALIRSIAENGVTVMQATPATWRGLLEVGWKGNPALKILCGGEPLPVELVRDLLPKGAELWNMYGPTETTIWSTCCRVFDTGGIHIGRPVANTEIYIVDAGLQPAPIGVSGELLIGGDGLARGYLRRPDLTAEKFIPHPFKPGSRLYRTGDVARFRTDGSVECLGRMDYQLKVRGFRIEPGEIEVALVQHPAVKQSVVVARELAPGDQRLVAYCVLNPEVQAPNGELREHLLQHLPPYMIPQHFVNVEAIPLTPNGKVDRKALPGLGAADQEAPRDRHSSGTADEAEAISAWSRKESEWSACLAIPRLCAMDGVETRLNQLCAAYMARYFNAYAMEFRKGASVTVTELETNLEMSQDFRKFVSYMLSVLGDDGFLERQDGNLQFLKDSNELPDPRLLHESLIRSHPQFSGLLLMLEHCSARLHEAISGVIPAISVLYPDGHRDFLDRLLYRETVEHTNLRVYEELAREFLVARAQERPVRILEVGGGVGSLTWRIVPELKGLGAEYVFTDIGVTFVAEARKKASQLGFQFVQSRKFDISLPGPEQGLEEGSFDIVFGLNVVHATPDIQASIGHLRKLLKPGGKICLVELVRAPRWENFVWGFAKGWWCFRDGCRTSIPIVDLDTWESVFRSEGLSVWALPASEPERSSTDAGFIVGTTAPAKETAIRVKTVSAPRNAIEEELIAIWENVLNRSPIGVHDDFFELGGHSLLAVKLFIEIERRMGRSLPLATLFSASTVERLAREFDKSGPLTAGWSSLVTIQSGGLRPKLFCVHGAGGNVLLYRDLAASLGNDYPVYGFQSLGLDGKVRPLTSVEAMAAHYLIELKSVQPDGPYCLAGYCLGGLIAYEMARMLREAGDKVMLLALLDSYNPGEAGTASRTGVLWQRAKFHLRNLTRMRPADWGRYLGEKMRVARDGELSNLLGKGRVASGSEQASSPDRIESPGVSTGVQALNDLAASEFRPLPYDGPLVLFKPQINYNFLPDPMMGWGNLARGGIEVVELPVNPHAMLVEPFVKHLAGALRSQLNKVSGQG